MNKYFFLILLIILFVFISCDQINKNSVQEFHSNYKNNKDLLFFNDHSIIQLKSHIFKIDGLVLSTIEKEVSIKIPAGLQIWDETKKGFRDFTESDLTDEYIDIIMDLFNKYKQLPVKSIISQQGYIMFHISHYDYLLYITNHDIFNMDQFIVRWAPQDLNQLDSSWYQFSKLVAIVSWSK